MAGAVGALGRQTFEARDSPEKDVRGLNPLSVQPLKMYFTLVEIDAHGSCLAFFYMLLRPTPKTELWVVAHD